MQFSKNRFPFKKRDGGDEENRTPDPLLARQMLSQLSYTPIVGFIVIRSYPVPYPDEFPYSVYSFLCPFDAVSGYKEEIWWA